MDVLFHEQMPSYPGLERPQRERFREPDSSKSGDPVTQHVMNAYSQALADPGIKGLVCSQSLTLVAGQIRARS